MGFFSFLPHPVNDNDVKVSAKTSNKANTFLDLLIELPPPFFPVREMGLAPLLRLL
jgi:hypothetical protein